MRWGKWKWKWEMVGRLAEDCLDGFAVITSLRLRLLFSDKSVLYDYGYFFSGESALYKSCILKAQA